MGCCGSKDTEAEEEGRAEVPAGNTGSRLQAVVMRVSHQPQYGVASIQHYEPRHSGSRVQQPVGKVCYQKEYGIGWSVPPRVPGPAVEIYNQEADRIAHSAHHNEERHFFQLFFSVMDHFPGYQGILRRWEKEDQQAEFNKDRCEMGKVWLDGCGYVKSLQLMKLFVANKKFSSADRLKLTEWAMKVVNRRSAEYNAAKAKGKANSQHLMVLEAWRDVKNTLQNLTWNGEE